MKYYEFVPKGVCSKKMIFTIENDIVRNVEIIGGCPGNSLGIVSLCKNQPIDYIINQLSIALEQYKKETN